MISPLLVLLEALTAISIVGGAAAGLIGARRLDRREQAALLGLAATAIVVRAWAPAAPHDVNFRAWGAYSEGALDIERGFGFTAWARLWHALIPAWAHSERWLFDVAVLAGAAAPLALFAWLRAQGATLAWFAAILLALATPHVRFSHTDAQQIPALTWGLIGLAAWSAHARAPSWWAALLGASATAAAACGRLEWAVWPALVLVVISAEGVPLRHPATWFGGALVASVTSWHVWAIFHGDGSWATGGYAHGAGAWLWEHPLVRFGPEHLIWLDRAFTPWPLALAIGLGAFVAPMSRTRRAALIFASIALSCVVPTWTPIHAGAFAIARYQLVALPFALTLAAGTFAAAAERVAALPGRVVVGMIVVALGAWRLPLDWAPTTQSAEYTFLAAAIPSLPSGCTVVIDTWTTDAGLAFPTHLTSALRPDLRLVGSDAWTPDLSACTLYYRAASCVAHAQEADDMPVRTGFCVGLGPGYETSPLKVASLPSRRWVYDTYDVEPVPVGFFRVTAAGAP